MSFELFGQLHQHLLVEEGDTVALNNQNKRDYVDRLVHWHLIESIHDQLEELILGFL